VSSRGAASTGLSTLPDRPAAAPGNGIASNNRSSAAGTPQGSDFQALLAGSRNAKPPAATESAGSSQQSGRGESRDADRRKARDATDGASDASTVRHGTSPGLDGAGNAGGAASAAGPASAAATATLSSPHAADESSGRGTADGSGASAASTASGVSTASAASTASGASPASSASPVSAASPASADKEGWPAPGPADSAKADSAALANAQISSSTAAASPTESIGPDGQEGTAGAAPATQPAPPAQGSPDTPLGAAALSAQAEQLRAWLSGTATLQSGTAGPTAPGPSAAGPASTNSATGGAVVSGPSPAGVGLDATAVAAELALSASGIQPGETTTGASASGDSSDAVRADSLSSDFSQSLNALLSTNALPLHLADAAHAGGAQASGVLQSPLGTSAWVEELGTQLSWMANRGIESASLHVSPAELGPIEVRIAVHGSDASIWFGAAQATTRTALEQTLPQLRQLLGSHGLTLSDAGVFREPPRGSAHQAPSRSVAPISAASEETSRTVNTHAAVRLGLLDLYA